MAHSLKSGYYKAAEAQASQPAAATSSEKKADEEKPTKAKKPPRKIDDDLRATSQIMDILRKFSPMIARRILRTCGEKIEEHDGNIPKYVDDPRRLPGGDLYTAPLPGLEDRDHG